MLFKCSRSVNCNSKALLKKILVPVHEAVGVTRWLDYFQCLTIHNNEKWPNSKFFQQNFAELSKTS